MKKTIIIKLFLPTLLFFSVFAVSAQDSTYSTGSTENLPIAEKFTGMLGMTPDTAFKELGVPDSIFPYRGETPEEDNVVFYYKNNTYIFWFHDRVWQIRADKRWDGSLDGVSMGMKKQKIFGLWGNPINNFDPQPTWVIAGKPFPVRIRLYFNSEDRLDDLYVYRSDW